MNYKKLDKENYLFIEPINADQIIELAKKIIQDRLIRAGPQIYSSETAKGYLALNIGSLEQEVFACLFLDQHHRIIACEELFHGTINHNTIYPREIAKRALFHNAAALIISHNHPSGDCQPSQQDKDLTSKVKNAMELVEVHVLDHIIIAGANSYSFADNGLI